MYHRFMSRVLVVLLVVACTKPNPARTCHDGTCTDPTYPFCDADGAVGGEPNTCIAVTCTAGSVFECRSDGALVCNATGDNYDVMACPAGCVDGIGCNTACTTNAECATNICKSDGICALESEIAYTLPSAIPTADCSRANPCTLSVALQTTKAYVILAEGDYLLQSELLLSGTRTLMGQGSMKTLVHATQTEQNDFRIDAGAAIVLMDMQIRDAAHVNQTGGAGGNAIECPNVPTGTRSLHLVDVILTHNAQAGIDANECDIAIERTTVVASGLGVGAYRGTISIDRSTFTNNSTLGALSIYFATSTQVTNSFFVRNPAMTVNLGMLPAGSVVFDFNTIVDNGACGLTCNQLNNNAARNNIIARNGSGQNTCGDSSCTTPGSILDTTVTAIKFTSPDAAPYDYHITTGSSAVDTALGSTLDHDFDGDMRPHGSGWDVGADEL
jgi:hypothetical protein